MLKTFISLGTLIIWFFSCLSGMALMYYSLTHWWPEVPLSLQFIACILGLVAGISEAYKTYGD